MTVRNEELGHLKGMLVKMAALVESAIQNGVQSLVERNSDLARSVIEGDHKVTRWMCR